MLRLPHSIAARVKVCEVKIGELVSKAYGLSDIFKKYRYTATIENVLALIEGSWAR